MLYPGKKHGARASRKAFAINLRSEDCAAARESGCTASLFQPPISVRDDGATLSVAAESTWNPGNTFDRWNNSFRRKSTLFPVYGRIHRGVRARGGGEGGGGFYDRRYTSSGKTNGSTFGRDLFVN